MKITTRLLGKLLFGSIAILSFLLPPRAYSETKEEQFKASDLVEVHIKANPMSDSAYANKRTRWASRFGLTYESVLPKAYISPADGTPYKNIFGQNTVPIASLSLGTQLNTKIGGFFLDLIAGKGTATGLVGSNATLALTKYGISYGMVLDTLFSDPWASIFFGGQLFKLDWNEKDTSLNIGGTTEFTTGYIAGITLHLNKVDSESAAQAYIDHGLKNTFLDLTVTQYNTSNASTDPDFQTDTNFGAAFRLEF